MDAEDLRHTRTILDTAKPGDLVVVAVVSPDGAVITTLNPEALRLVDLASSLLDQARDCARGPLRRQITRALTHLPDRFEPATPVEG